ncbi:MAG: alpha/beta hydrolase [Desulfobacteraceae bacterium]|nr:alpha/beta hydrolase [Desulfobacteraceae bacterium]
MKQITSHRLSAIIKHIKSTPDFESTGIVQYRNLLEKGADSLKLDKSVKVESIQINAIDAQWLMPSQHNEKRIILYTHGGGYIAGSINSHKDLASRIAIASAAKVLIFNYRLAPEHPFPKGLEDVKTVYNWVSKTFHKTHKVILVGDSAGAGLTLSLLSELISGKHCLPQCSVLISPWIDLTCQNNSLLNNQENDPMLNLSELKKIARLYTQKNLSDPLISPINNDFTGAPPILIQTGENEILIDDSKILAQKLKKAGSSVQLEIWEDMFHVWHYFAKYLSQGRQAINNIGKFIKNYS